MKKIALAFIAVSALLCAGAEELNWLTDFPAAKARAKAENKLILMNFTGSDYCAGCIQLRKEVFSQPEFAEYAKKNLVLVEVDFPFHKEQSAELKKANQALQDKYGVEGYPTLLVLNSKGKKLGELNYVPGGPKAFIAEFEKKVKK